MIGFVTSCEHTRSPSDRVCHVCLRCQACRVTVTQSRPHWTFPPTRYWRRLFWVKNLSFVLRPRYLRRISDGFNGYLTRFVLRPVEERASLLASLYVEHVHNISAVSIYCKGHYSDKRLLFKVMISLSNVCFCGRCMGRISHDRGNARKSNMVGMCRKWISGCDQLLLVTW